MSDNVCYVKIQRVVPGASLLYQDSLGSDPEWLR